MDFGLGGDELVVSLAAVERQLEAVRSGGTAISRDPIVELRALRSQLVWQERAIESLMQVEFGAVDPVWEALVPRLMALNSDSCMRLLLQCYKTGTNW